VLQSFTPNLGLTILVADCQLTSVEGRLQLCSADSRTCVVRRTFQQLWDRCFATAGAFEGKAVEPVERASSWC